MEKLTRKVDTKERDNFKIIRFGYSSYGVFSIIYEEPLIFEEHIINLDKDEINKLKEFINKLK